jgi:hypothetical protein
MMVRLLMLLAVFVLAIAASAQPKATSGQPPQAAPETYPVTLQPDVFRALVAYLKRQPWEDVQPLMAGLALAADASAPRRPAPLARPSDSGSPDAIQR